MEITASQLRQAIETHSWTFDDPDAVWVLDWTLNLAQQIADMQGELSMLRSERERIGLLMDTLIANWSDPALAKDSLPAPMNWRQSARPKCHRL